MQKASRTLEKNYENLLRLKTKLSNLIETVETFQFTDPKLNFWVEVDHVFFDLDHTLCRYNMKDLNENIWSCWLNYLVTQRGYFPEIFGWKLDPSYLQRGIWFDTKEGIFIKLSNDCDVTKAYRGTSELTSAEIQSIYSSSVDVSLKERFKRLSSLFSQPLNYLIMLIVEDQNNRDDDSEPREYSEIFADVCDGHDYFYDKFDAQGPEWFANIRSNPSAFVLPRPGFLEFFQELRRSGVKIHLATNSRLEFTELLLNEMIGPKWREQFDLALVRMRKPRFFTENASFGEFESNNVLEEGWDKKSFRDDDSIWCHGNVQEMIEVLNLDDPSRIVFVGDSLGSDLIQPKKLGWKTIAIMEELDEGRGNECVSGELKYKVTPVSRWGNFWYYERKQTYTSNEFQDHSDIIVPDVLALSESMRAKFGKDELTYFSQACCQTFYPYPPKLNI